MAYRPITSWQIDGEKVESVIDFLFLGSKITGYEDCSHEIKRHLFLRRKAMTNLDSVLKSTDITLPTKVHILKAMVFPVVMYERESWMKCYASNQGACLPGGAIIMPGQSAAVLSYKALTKENRIHARAEMWLILGHPPRIAVGKKYFV